MTGAPIATAASICAGSAAMNKDTRMPASASCATAARNASRWPGGIEAAFRRSLGSPLGHDAGGVRSHFAGDRNHFRRCRHFQVERLLDGRLQPRDVVIDDVAAILAQMRGDAVGASRDRDLGGLEPDQDVCRRERYAQWRRDRRSRRGGGGQERACDFFSVQPLTRSALAITFFARNCEMIEVRCLRL